MSQGSLSYSFLDLLDSRNERTSIPGYLAPSGSVVVSIHMDVVLDLAHSLLSDSVFRVDVAIVAGSSVHYHVSGDGSEYSISKFSIESQDSLGESGLGCASGWPLVDILEYPGGAMVIGCSLPLFRVGGEHWISRFSFESEDSLENRGAREFRGTARFAISRDR